MILRNRVIFSDNGTKKDLSDDLNNHVSGTSPLPFVTAEDYLYLGSEAPFNHRWLEVGVVNANVSTPAIDIWDGANWIPCAEVIDLTKDASGTKSLSKSGMIMWVPDKYKTTWNRDDTQDNGSNVITGLSDLKIYGLFWVRIKWSADLSATATLAFMGHKFANDEDLYSIYPEFETTESKNRFKTGISTWDQVHFEATKQVIRDLKGQDVIASGNQILDVEVMKLPAIHKAAELIYSALGQDWAEEREQAKFRNRDSMKIELFNVDKNEDAVLDAKEMRTRVGTLTR